MGRVESRLEKMTKNLVIVESPAKARTIERYLGPGYHVLASYGHVRDLPENPGKNKLGVDVDNDFKPEYVISEDRKKQVAAIAKEARTADMVYLATDLDREGEAIAWHVAEGPHVKPDKTRRVTFSEITADAIKDAFAHPREIDHNLVDAQQTRRIMDRLVGYTLSPLLWRKVRSGLSAGRVQSVAVRLVVEREREINAFSARDRRPSKERKRRVWITVIFGGGGAFHSPPASRVGGRGAPPLPPGKAGERPAGRRKEELGGKGVRPCATLRGASRARTGRSRSRSGSWLATLPWS